MTQEWLAAGCIAVFPVTLLAQGFGAVKQTVTLERKLPAAAKLAGSSFTVKATAEAGVGPNCKALAADKLRSLVETELVRYDNQLTPNPAAPDTVISIRVMNCSAVSTPEYAPQFGKNAGRGQPVGFKVAADLSVTYEARGSAGGFVDAEPLDVKYNHENNAAKATFAGITGKADQEPHTAEELTQLLAERMAQRIAARLVNTNEKVDVLLGKGGAMDEANRYAVAGQWSKYVETLETMTPLAKPEDDAYRLYNIGVGDEALGYKAETPAAARKYFEQAVIQYRKAGEMNPKEKYFIPPVNRIEVALEHYKILAQPPKPPAEPVTNPPAQPKAVVAPVAAVAPPTARPVAGAAPQVASKWRVTEIINNVPVLWEMVASADQTFNATMGDAAIANGSWKYDAAKHSYELTGYNLVLKVPFTCAFTLASAQAKVMNGICVDQVGTKYKTDAVRQ